MNHPFEFRLPSGQFVRTGNQLPSEFAVSFANYPEADLLSFGEIERILKDPRRMPASELFGSEWILNQGRRSSCNAYAVAGCLSRIRYRMGLTHIDFGPEFLYALINGGTDRGSLLHDGMRAVSEHGICPRDLIPYEAYLPRDVTQKARQVAMNYRAFECYQFPTDSLEHCWHAMVSAACRNEMLVLAVHVGNRFLQSGRRAGFDRGPGNHAVGVDDAVLPNGAASVMAVELDMFNSWGASFGNDGRALIQPQHIREPMRYHAMYAIRSATLDSRTDNPFVRAV